MDETYKPEYAMKIQIVDETTGETVLQESALMPDEGRAFSGPLGMTEYQEESAETAFWNVIRQFRKPGGFQDKHQEVHYPKEDESDDE